MAELRVQGGEKQIGKGLITLALSNCKSRRKNGNLSFDFYIVENSGWLSGSSSKNACLLSLRLSATPAKEKKKKKENVY
jgi:hypothetical protein